MGDCIDAMLLDQARDEVGVARVANDQLRAFGHSPCEAGEEIVENDDRLAGVDKAENHMAADIPGAASHQNAHEASPLLSRPKAELAKKSRVERLGRN